MICIMYIYIFTYIYIDNPCILVFWHTELQLERLAIAVAAPLPAVAAVEPCAVPSACSGNASSYTCIYIYIYLYICDICDISDICETWIGGETVKHFQHFSFFSCFSTVFFTFLPLPGWGEQLPFHSHGHEAMEVANWHQPPGPKERSRALSPYPGLYSLCIYIYIIFLYMDISIYR